MFKVFHHVELAFRKQANENGLHFMRDGLETVLESFPKTELPKICCDDHRQELLPTLILEYLTIRCNFEVKRLKKIERGGEKGKSLRKKIKSSWLIYISRIFFIVRLKTQFFKVMSFNIQ